MAENCSYYGAYSMRTPPLVRGLYWMIRRVEVDALATASGDRLIELDERFSSFNQKGLAKALLLRI